MKIFSRNKEHDIKFDDSIAGISRQTINKIISAWNESGNSTLKIKPDLPKSDEETLRNLLEDCVNEKGGEISIKSKIIHLGIIYINLTDKGKSKFLRILARDFDISTSLLNEKINALKASKGENERINAELELSKALAPPRVKILRQLVTLPNGFLFLKDMRRDLIPLISTMPRLRKLDADIKDLLVTYFDINLLDLKEITWNSPAILLEKLMEYEAVHEIFSWKDLKHRLQTDRRIFAFFHNKMPNDPLIFIEVALVHGIPNSIQILLDRNIPPLDPNIADSAIFYSISSTQKGLKGISFGNFLIKRVVNELLAEFPNLKNFATLSPIPKFIEWLKNLPSENYMELITESEKKKLQKFSKSKQIKNILLGILDTKWNENNDISNALQKPLMRLCANYLINIKKRNDIAFDPVAHFHLMNGAKMQRINWLGDTSENGLKQSAGIMVNYYYKLNKIIANHENYFNEGKVCSSKEARSWLKK
ncbi:MAG: malonyl-CoA decarboxylase family protein [Bacteroidales bacterium]|nr:malonyl-CoA decarboxylase family protein [Bacteroidales bacterium]